jgi:hypothetical protein
MRSIKILDFDIETRPLSFWYDGKPTAEITAIASCWADDPDSLQVYLLGQDTAQTILNSFVSRYNEADVVTGHYIRRFDLPTINGALMEYGMAPLGPKMTVDTKLDLMKRGDIPASQEFLGELFDLEAPKVGMSQVKWRKANRLNDKDSLTLTRVRCAGDVIQHMQLRVKLVELGLLGPMKVWHP